MVLHVGKDAMVPLKDVILILDYKEARIRMMIPIIF